jgi:hypothetical protein
MGIMSCSIVLTIYSFVASGDFQLKETLQIRIAEEANLCLIKVKTIRSTSNKLIIAGRNFYMCATYSVQYGWHVSKACYRAGDNFSIIPQNHRVIEEKGL